MADRDIKDYMAYNPVDGTLMWTKRSAYGTKETRKVNLNTKGRPKVQFNRRTYQASVVAWYLFYGEWPNKQVDHIDNDTSNIKITNLRLVTQMQNNMNRRKLKVKSSPFKGVSKTKAGAWKASIRINKIALHLGTFKTEIEAAIAYDKSAKENFGEYAKVNGVKL